MALRFENKQQTASAVKGRGAQENPSGRFEAFTREVVQVDLPPDEGGETPCLKTTLFKDSSRSIISLNDSFDVYMDATLNPYRGCEHGCIYCYARPTHEYLGLSAGLDFETKIYMKENAAQLLQHKLQSPRWQPRVLSLSGITDPYQPIEKEQRITRACLEVLTHFRNPVSIITKNQLVVRDCDLLQELAQYHAVAVFISVTTLDNTVARAMEPRASSPRLRLKAMETLAKAGIPVGVMIGPVVPGLTDMEIPEILRSAAEAGAQTAGYTMVRLPYGVKDLFQSWLHTHFPDRAEKVLNRIRSIRNGALNDARMGTRMRGEGFFADQVAQIFRQFRMRYGLDKPFAPLSSAAFRRNALQKQLSLFE